MDETVILYSTGCPRCKVLTQKLKDKNIDFVERNSVEDMLSLNITEVPMLCVGHSLLDFKSAVEWVNNK